MSLSVVVEIRSNKICVLATRLISVEGKTVGVDSQRRRNKHQSLVQAAAGSFRETHFLLIDREEG